MKGVVLAATGDVVDDDNEDEVLQWRVFPYASPCIALDCQPSIHQKSQPEDIAGHSMPPQPISAEVKRAMPMWIQEWVDMMSQASQPGPPWKGLPYDQ